MYLSPTEISQASGYSSLKRQLVKLKYVLLATMVLSASVTVLFLSFVCLPNPTSSLLSCPGTASAAMVSSSSREHSVDDFLAKGPVSRSIGRRQRMSM
uniref:Uncharacterized protein n=1 Tax=Meloidogyne incognita TaxID=6306 RepID=A0A914MBG2_MELIC